MKKEGAEKIGFSAFLLNIFLFILKLAAGLLSGSLAVISDAFNSFLDSLSYLLAFFSIKVANMGPDRDHPFGHRRAEPLSAMVVAIFTGVLGIEILKAAAGDILTGQDAVAITSFTFAALIISIIVKLAMHFHLKRKAKEYMSSSLGALSIDSRNDVLATSIALIGIGTEYAGIPMMDKVAAVAISAYILRAGYLLARENIDYLMGASPKRETILKLRNAAKSVKGVKGVSILRAHYVGDRLHVEAGIVLDKKLAAKKTHEIGERVQKKLEKMQAVSRAFIHIDYD
jgi:cation diffusion facilitator family transporter